jgi:hypothetical protein
MNRRAFIRGAVTSTIGATAGAYLFAYSHDTHDIEITTVQPKIGLNRPLRMVALGDIHFDPLFEETYIARVCRLVTDLRPDIILYTGDFITAHANRIDDLSDLLSQSVSRLGSFAVPGNHEHWTGLPFITRSLESRGIRVLRNDLVALPGEEAVYLTGLDSFWSGQPDLTIFSRTPDDSRHILLVHEPDSFNVLDDPRIKLQISGHTHGGQVRLPLYGAVVLPKLGKNFETGSYRRDNRHLYVNRGIGTLTPHVRLNCRPEITVFDLT